MASTEHQSPDGSRTRSKPLSRQRAKRSMPRDHKTPSPAEEAKTISVPEAGQRYFGLSRNAAYDAARRGQIPTIRIGRLLRSPIILLERMLERAGDNQECNK
jgi:hypothetical protein